jgi:hypothetical protein
MNNYLSIKKKITNFFYNQFIVNFLAIVICVLLTYKKYSPIFSAVCMVILYYYSYFIHKLFHFIPECSSIHLYFHHNNEKNIIINNLNLFIELLTNIGFFAIFYYIQKFFGNIFPVIIIFYYGFIYTSVHIINYSIFHSSKAHLMHHKTSNNDIAVGEKTCNYGPDLVDHIFQTNYDDNFENYDHIIPNILISFLVTYYIFKPEI